jgi:hypothetical protein
MSRYTYGYSLAPARPTGWRSAFGNFIGVTAVVSLSVISGAVVAYNLIGGDARFFSTPVSSTAVAPAQARAETPVQAPVKQLPTKAATTGSAASAPQPVTTLAASESPKRAARADAPAVVAVVATAAAAPVAAPPAAPVVRNDEAAIPAGDLTFAKGYALRRAARQAAAQAASPKAAAPQTATANSKVAAVAVAADEPGAASEKQFGRPAVIAKRKPSAVAQYPRNERYGMFERFDGPRHQALAFGDSSPQRPVRRSGGWFDGLF